MNANNITVVTLAVLWLAAIAVVVYDRIKYNKYYSSQGKLIVLRFNDSTARKALEEQGFNLCQCAYFNTNRYLFTTEGDRICGFTEECTHLIEDAIKHHQEVIECDNVGMFISEVKKLQQEYEINEEVSNENICI